MSITLSHLQNFLASHSALMPVVGIGCAGLAVALLRVPKESLRPFGVSESESIMNFSSLGTLRCVCGQQHEEHGAPDRRQFCRSCGCEVVASDPNMLVKELSSKDIKVMTRQLRSAAIRARNMELPPSITSIEELNRYLADAAPPSNLPPPSRPTTVEQPQVQ